MSFKVASVGHFFAIAVHDVKAAIHFLAEHKAGIEVAADAISLIDPQLAPLVQTMERAGEALLGDALALVDKLDDATQTKGVSLPIDPATATALKKLLADIRKIQPSASAIPAGLPTVAQ